MADALSDFKASMQSYAFYAYGESKRWKLIYWVSRSALIVFGILTSAEALGAIPFLRPVQPYFGLMVALITGFEVFFQPETKYKAFYIANDEYDQLEKKVGLTVLPGDMEAIKEAQKEYEEINKRLQKAL